MTAIVEAIGVRKSFGDFEALRGIDFSVEKGSIVGLIGPNGAGKTTTLKSLLGLCSFEGELLVQGRDPRSQRHQIMESVCFIADVGILPRWLRVDQAMDYIEGVHPNFARDRAEELLATTSISTSQRIRSLSKGMVTQLHLALVMAIEVDLLVLDEPTLGLDILYRKEFYDRLLNDYYDADRSIIISTHQVEEIEALLTHLIFIDEGEIILDIAMDDIPNRFSEVLIHPDKVVQARALNPIYERDLLGRKGLLFEDRNADELADLGEIHVPGVADLFVAKMRGARS
jgi:ABC-2 type transport system ATP-binding protein|tara:strand:+ start:1507 stop:2364 length:858 start_codon:yes stop_codon:yes gene_type:complete